MLRYRNLLFFNKRGEPYNFKYEETAGIWTGTIHLGEISAGLFENEHIFLLEKLEDLGNNLKYGYPHFDDSLSSNPLIRFSWEKDNSTEISFYQIENPLEDTPVIEQTEEILLLLDIDPFQSINLTTERVVTSVIQDKAAQINLFLSGPEEGEYIRDLLIEDETGVFAKIEVYGVVIGEDERLRENLKNFGKDLYFDVKDEHILATSDIHEALPDWKSINIKRKELLIEKRNIFPHLLTYSGLSNIIKFFGYNNLRLKEYWKNVDRNSEGFGRYLHKEVKLFEGDKEDSDVGFLPNQTYKKTSYFGLFYDITRVKDDEFDEFGIPIVERAFLFTNEEILIKLNGLRNYLKRNVTGSNSKIIDIVGEAIYFHRNSLNTWNDRNSLVDLDINIEPKFLIGKESGYIQDLRPILIDEGSCLLPADWGPDNNNDEQLYQAYNCYVGRFADYFYEVQNFQDGPNIPIGFPLQLGNLSFKVSWSECDFSWVSTEEINLTVTWETISHLNYYDIEWIVEREYDESYYETYNEFLTRKFKHSRRGNLNLLEEYVVILPYVGFYTITLKLYDFNNGVSISKKLKAVEVRIKEPDFISFARVYDIGLQRWDENYLLWSEIHNQWDTIIYDNGDFLIGENRIDNFSLNVVKYLNFDRQGIKNFGINSFTWEEYENNLWEDFDNTLWLYYDFPRERLAKFEITGVKASGLLQIGSNVHEFNNYLALNNFAGAGRELSAETDDDTSNFIYTPRPLGNPTYIDAVSVPFGKIGNRYVAYDGVGVMGTTDPLLSIWGSNPSNWEDFPILWGFVENCYYAKNIDGPFNMDDLKFFSDSHKIPLCTPLFIVYDNSEMAGKTIGKWELFNEDFGTKIFEIDSEYIIYTFTVEGNYSIALTLEDNNGNKGRIYKRGWVNAVKN